MLQVGWFLLLYMLGIEMFFFGLVIYDGVLLFGQVDGEKILDLCEVMLVDFKVYDLEIFIFKGQIGDDGYWYDDMFWYGLVGIGFNYCWSGFEKDYWVFFLIVFLDWVGGDYYCWIGDGNYVVVSGWLFMIMIYKGDYLGVLVIGKFFILCVMDFYCCVGGKIMENWVMFDYLDLFQ